MYRFTEDFWNDVVTTLNQYGINPTYLATIVSLIVVYSYKKEFKNWSETEPWKKGLAGSALFGATTLVIFSILTLFGVMG